MPEALVDVRMSAKDAELVSAWQRQTSSLTEFNSALEKTAAKAKTAGAHGKEAFQSIGAGIKSTVGQLGGMLAGFQGVKTVVEGIVEGCKHIQEEAKKAIEGGQEGRNTLMKDLGRTGDVGRMEEVETRLRGIDGVKKGEAEQVLKGIRAGAPELTLDKALELNDEAAKISPLTDDTGREAFGGTVAKMARFAPKKSAKELANMAKSVQERAGGRSDELLAPGFELTTETMTGQLGMSPEEALGYELAGLKAGLNAKAMQSIVAKSVEKPKIDAKHVHTKEDLAKYRFSKLAPREGFERLLNDKETRDAVVGDLGVKFSQIDKSYAAEQAKGITGDEPGLLAKRTSEAQQKNPNYFAERNNQAEKLKASLARGKAFGIEQQKRDRERRQIAAEKHSGAAVWAEANRENVEDLFNALTPTDQLKHRNDVLEFFGLQVGDNTKGNPDPRWHTGPRKPAAPGVEGRKGDTSIVMPPGGGAPIVNGRAAPDRLEGGASQELLEHARKQTAHAEAQTKLLEQVVAKPQTVAVSVETGRGRGMRFDATERGEKSPSAVLGMNH
jgi:hypothetical protein